MAQLLQEAHEHKRAGRVRECEALCTQLVTAGTPHGHMWEAYCMLADCAMSGVDEGTPADKGKRAAEFYRKAGAEDCRPADISSELWACKRSKSMLYAAKVYLWLDDIANAEVFLRESLDLNPAHNEAYKECFRTLQKYGRVAEAVQLYEAFRQSKDEQAGETEWLCACLFAKNFICNSKEGSDKLYDESVAHGNMLIAQHAHLRRTGHNNTKDINRPLKVGYVSGDLHRTHAVARFSWVLLELDRARFQVFVYNSRDLSSFEENPKDSMRHMVDKWVDIWGLDTAAAVRAIVADEIDILVDLAGITFNHRLDVFACSAAPIQVTWIGYPNTTGVETIHYRVTDAVTDPMATTQQFSEKLIRLPDCFLCYAPKGFVDQMPPVSAPPSEENGYITFGSFNQIAKVQHECLELWCRVLRAVPNSRINLKYLTFKAEAFREEWFAKFHARGIARERVTFMSFFPATSGHLAAYNLHDISLDTFPYNGTTTTVDSLLMGVPVVTLRSPSEACIHAHNVSAGILTALGQPDLVAQSEDEFVEIAKNLARSPERLHALRHGLRNQFCSSPMGNSARYRSNVEDMYRKMWVQFCQDDYPICQEDKSPK